MNDPTAQLDRRPGLLGWVIRHRWLTTFLSIALLLALTVFLLDMAADNRLRRQLDAIRAAGEPLTVADLAARMPQIPDDENLYVALTACVTDPVVPPDADIDQSKLLIVGTARDPGIGRRMSDDERETAERYLAAVAPQIACLDEALKLERGHIPLQLTSPAIGIVLPGLGEYRQAAKVLSVQATLAREHGDMDTAIERLEKLVYMDRALDSNDTIICALVRMAVQSLAYDQVGRTVNAAHLEDPALRRLEALVKDSATAIDLKRVLIGERTIFIDTLEWTRARGGTAMATGGTGFSPSGWQYVPVIPKLDEAKGLALYTALVEAVSEPDHLTLKRIRAIPGADSLDWYCLFSKMLMPSLTRSAELWVRSVAEKRSLQAAIACERYRLRHGGFPGELQVLVPDYLDAVSLDPFDGKPLRYKRIDEGIVAYSIGEDESDHGGDVGRLEPASPRSSKRPPDLGWVILRPDLRGLPAEPSEKPD